MPMPTPATNEFGSGAWPPALTIGPLARATGVVALPGSKSISNRCLLLAALATGTTILEDLLAADDTEVMLDALAVLGVVVERNESAATCVVRGTAGAFPMREAQLFLGNAGTAFRSLTAALAVLGGTYELAGVPRMHERPIGDLVDALRAVGCDVRYLGANGYPPLAIGRNCGGGVDAVAIRGAVSSQFLSALLMALPLARRTRAPATRVTVIDGLVSRPYVAITTNLMRRFGVTVAMPDAATFIVPAGARYTSPGTLKIEGDASAAAYFLVAGAIGGGPVRVTGAGRDSIQGDVAFADALAEQGATISFGPDWIEARRGKRFIGGTIDCLAIPDAAMTLAITALFAAQPTTLTGIASWRVKETDRIAAMATELSKLGAQVEHGEDWLRISPLKQFQPAVVETYDDHRIAMCFALVALAGVPVTINDPGCVRKTFPTFFSRLEHLTRD
ncbi:MAG: 3-phosphoshikimate 1-carboxyvinyltransferase [Casimicrobiaceae bacterium]